MFLKSVPNLLGGITPGYVLHKVIRSIMPSGKKQLMSVGDHIRLLQVEKQQDLPLPPMIVELPHGFRPGQLPEVLRTVSLLQVKAMKHFGQKEPEAHFGTTMTLVGCLVETSSEETMATSQQTTAMPTYCQAKNTFATVFSSTLGDSEGWLTSVDSKGSLNLKFLGTEDAFSELYDFNSHGFYSVTKNLPEYDRQQVQPVDFSWAQEPRVRGRLAMEKALGDSQIFSGRYASPHYRPRIRVQQIELSDDPYLIANTDGFSQDGSSLINKMYRYVNPYRPGVIMKVFEDIMEKLVVMCPDDMAVVCVRLRDVFSNDQDTFSNNTRFQNDANGDVSLGEADNDANDKISINRNATFNDQDTILHHGPRMVVLGVADGHHLSHNPFSFDINYTTMVLEEGYYGAVHTAFCNPKEAARIIVDELLSELIALKESLESPPHSKTAVAKIMGTIKLLADYFLQCSPDQQIAVKKVVAPLVDQLSEWFTKLDFPMAILERFNESSSNIYALDSQCYPPPRSSDDFIRRLGNRLPCENKQPNVVVPHSGQTTQSTTTPTSITGGR